MIESSVLFANLGYVCGFFGGFWLISVALRDVSIVDSLWGLGFVVIAWATYCSLETVDLHDRILITVVTIWGLRLAGYLTWRNSGKPEDFRYAKMRQAHGATFPLRSLVTIFLLQAALAWIIAFPIQYGFGAAAPRTVLSDLSLIDLIGLSFWLIGFGFESVGDFQLARFKADSVNQGKVMNRGLWRFTRHPNYFGDFMVWWGFYLLAATPETWYWTIVGPLLMSTFLIRVTGVTMLERGIKSRVSGYEQYTQQTSSFFPWPPKKPNS